MCEETNSIQQQEHMSEQHSANHPHCMLQLLGTWQRVGTGASLPVYRKLTQVLPSHLADLLFDPLAIVCVHCCVDIRAQEVPWTKCCSPYQPPPEEL